MRHLPATLILLAASVSWAHPDDAWIGQSRSLALWAQAVSHQDTKAIAAATAAGSPPFPGSPDTTVITRYATFTPTDRGVVAAPVVLTTDLGTVRSAWSVLLMAEGNDWKVAGAMPSGDVPSALIGHDLAELAETTAVTFELSDADTGAPVYARVRITDAAGRYWPPQGHQKHIRTGWRQDVGGDVNVGGETYAYVSPRFTAPLPEGDFLVEVRKGTEYVPASRTFSVAGAGTEPPVVTLPLRRWVDMSARGWHAGDTHTHFLDEHSALAELRAEDLSLVYILATQWGELITDVATFTGAPSPVSGEREVVVVNEEARHGWLGHTILHGIDSLVYPLAWGGPSEGVAGGYDHPPMAHLADEAHAQGGLVTWAHFPYPAGELPVDVALGKVDTVDLFTWGDAFAPGPTLPGGITLPSAVETYYLFLNTNARLPVTAGTDKMINTQVIGSVRTYARTGRDFSYPGWLEALRRGETMVTTGPVLSLTANGSPIGSELSLAPGSEVVVEARLEAPWTQYPVDALEIVVGGQVAAATANTDQRSMLEARATVNVTSSTWIAARAHGSRVMPYQVWQTINAHGIPPMAHTSPIYVNVGDAPVWRPEAAYQLRVRVDAAINWVKTQGNFRSTAAREEMDELFQQARTYYATGPH